jgi:hypothetical protein
VQHVDGLLINPSLISLALAMVVVVLEKEAVEAGCLSHRPQMVVLQSTEYRGGGASGRSMVVVVEVVIVVLVLAFFSGCPNQEIE